MESGVGTGGRTNAARMELKITFRSSLSSFFCFFGGLKTRMYYSISLLTFNPVYPEFPQLLTSILFLVGVASERKSNFENIIRET